VRAFGYFVITQKGNAIVTNKKDQSCWIMAAIAAMAFCTTGYVLIVWRVASGT
jgi:hypothetical protein